MVSRTRYGGYGRSKDFWSNVHVPDSSLDHDTSQYMKYQFSGLPIIGDFMRADDYNRYMTNYLKARGMTWSDVKYPSLARGAGSGARAVGSMVDAGISAGTLRAIMRLYR